MKHLVVFLCLIFSETISVCVAGRHVYTPYGCNLPNFQPVPTSSSSVKEVPRIANSNLEDLRPIELYVVRSPIINLANFQSVENLRPVQDTPDLIDAAGLNPESFRQDGMRGMTNSLITNPRNRGNRGK